MSVMQEIAAVTQSFARRAWTAAALAAAGLMLALLLSDGTAGGDENSVVSFAMDFSRHGWQGAMARSPDMSYLAHRLFWLFEKITWSGILDIAAPHQALNSTLLHTYLLVLDGPLFMLAAVALATWSLMRSGHGWPVAVLAVACLLVASSGISLFTGGYVECLMSLLIVAITGLLDRREPLSAGLMTLLFLCGFALIFSKLYSAPFLLLLTVILPATPRQKLLYAGLMLAAPAAWLVAQGAVRGPATHVGMVSFYLKFMNSEHLLYNAAASIFSLSFGLLPCFPLLASAFLADGAHRRRLAVKLAALGTVLLMLIPFDFWFGPGGTGGPRYIVPFLLVLLPEVAQGLERLACGTGRRMLLLVPLLGLFFLPTLDYRNSLITGYAHQVSQVHPIMSIAWPHANPAIHPAIFAWRVETAKMRSDRALVPASAMPISLTLADVFPMTGLSRAIYLLESPPSGRREALMARNALQQRGLADIRLWTGLRLLLVAMLLGGLTWAALAAGKGCRQ